MACNCIEKKEAELQEKTGDPEAFIDAILDYKKMFRRFETKGFYRAKIVIPFVKDLFHKNYSSTFIPFDYCPLCGKKYDEEGNNNVL